jgi:hypothetical protein
MTDERRKYLKRMRQRYVRADRKERGRLLDEREAVAGHRPGVLGVPLRPGCQSRRRRVWEQAAQLAAHHTAGRQQGQDVVRRRSKAPEMAASISSRLHGLSK